VLRVLSLYPQETRDADGQPIAGVGVLIDSVDTVVDLNRRVVAAVRDEGVAPPLLASGPLPPAP
jgi:hypothetical protein